MSASGRSQVRGISREHSPGFLASPGPGPLVRGLGVTGRYGRHRILSLIRRGNAANLCAGFAIIFPAGGPSLDNPPAKAIE